MILHRDGRIPETCTRLYLSMPAWRIASSSDCGRYLCLPTPMLKKNAEGIGVLHSDISNCSCLICLTGGDDGLARKRKILTAERIVTSGGGYERTSREVANFHPRSAGITARTAAPPAIPSGSPGDPPPPGKRSTAARQSLRP